MEKRETERGAGREVEIEEEEVETQFQTEKKKAQAKEEIKASLLSLADLPLPQTTRTTMAVEAVVALLAVLAAALAVRWARHHGPLRPRGAPPILEGTPLVGGLLKFAKVSG